jgi:hypothetical protein
MLPNDQSEPVFEIVLREEMQADVLDAIIELCREKTAVS